MTKHGDVLCISSDLQAGHEPICQHEKRRNSSALWLQPIVLLVVLGLIMSLGCGGKDKREEVIPSTTSGNMVAIPEGVFTLGTNDGTDLEAPARPVTTDAYWIDKYEYPSVAGERPLVNVTWYQAQEKCTLVGKRLCTEREWEKACRGPEGWLYPYGNSYQSERCRTGLAWNEGAAEIGSTGCFSQYGVGDMSGNVQEWTLGESIEERAVRGGFWNSSGYQARCTTRAFFNTIYSDDTVGFRCCKSESE